MFNEHTDDNLGQDTIARCIASSVLRQMIRSNAWPDEPVMLWQPSGITARAADLRDFRGQASEADGSDRDLGAFDEHRTSRPPRVWA